MDNTTITISKFSLMELKSLMFMLLDCLNKKQYSLYEEEETNTILHISISEMTAQMEEKIKKILGGKPKKKWDIKWKLRDVCAFIAIFHPIIDLFGPMEKSLIIKVCHQYDYWKTNRQEFYNLQISNNYETSDKILNE